MDETNPSAGYSRVLLEQLADKWSLLVLSVLCAGPARFNDIRRSLGGISQRTLVQCLRRLQRNGLVDREVRPTSPVRVEYGMTPLGRTLYEPLEALRVWTERYESEVLKAQAEFDARTPSGDADDELME